jgi:hypothetical protein
MGKQANRRNLGILVLLFVLITIGLGGFYIYTGYGSGRRPSGSGSTATGDGTTVPELLDGPELTAEYGQPGNPLAELVRVRRTVKAKRAEELAWDEAQVTMELFGNDAVRTFDRSTADILFGQGDMVKVDENTLIIITPRRSHHDEDEISVAFLSPDLLEAMRDRPVEEQRQKLLEAAAEREVRISVVATEGVAPSESRLDVKTLSDASTTFASRSGTLRVVGPQGTEVILQENTATRLDEVGDLLKPPRALPAAPDLVKPRHGATYATQRKAPRVRLRWKAVPRATVYRLVVANDPRFEAIFADELLDHTGLVLHNLEPGTYYWRVAAQDAEGFEGRFSDARKLETLYDDIPPNLTIVSPPDMFIAPVPSVDLVGKTDRGARVRVNGEPVTVRSDGTFKHTVSLTEGVKLITVEALDSAGNVKYGKRLIHYRGPSRSKVAVMQGER